MTTTPTRTVLKAVRQPDGTYTVPASCCRPEACAPAVGVRCCLTARCRCPLPSAYGVAWAMTGRPAPAPVPVAPKSDGKARLVLLTVAGTVGVGTLGGIALGIAQAVAWVVSHGVLILGGMTAVGLLLVLLGGIGGGSRMFSGTFKGRMH